MGHPSGTPGGPGGHSFPPHASGKVSGKGRRSKRRKKRS